MSVKINVNVSTRNKKGNLISYKRGEVIKLNADDEEDLINRGFAEPAIDKPGQSDEN